MIFNKRNTLSSLQADTWLRSILVLAAATAVGILLLIVLFLIRESWSALQHVGVFRFVSDTGWHPLEGAFNLVPMLIANVCRLCRCYFSGRTARRSFCSIRALLCIACCGCRFQAHCSITGRHSFCRVWPVGLNRVSATYRKMATHQGASLLAGILILTFMVLPTVALTAEAALNTVPESYLRGANALGLSRAGIILNVAIPAARSGIIGGILLATARALGETMAVLMVAGNVVQVPTSLFDPVRVLTANIALEMAYATGDHRAALFVSGLATDVAGSWFSRYSG